MSGGAQTGSNSRADLASLVLLTTTIALLAMDIWVVSAIPYAAPVTTVIREMTFVAAWVVVGVVALRVNRALLARRVLALSLVLAGNMVGSFGLQGTDLPARALVTMSAILVPFQVAFGAHLFISFPSGRAGDGFGRRLIVVAYTLAGLQSVWWALAHVNRADCVECARSLTLVGLPRASDQIVSTIVDVAWVGLCVCVVILLGSRYRRAGRRERSLLRLPYATTTVAIVVYGVLSIAAATQGVSSVWLVSTDAAVIFQLIVLLGVPLSLLIGLLRERLAYRKIGDLVVNLARGESADLEQSLATALGDPQLTVAFPVEAGYVDTHGRAVPDPRPDEHTTVTAVGDAAAPLALIHHDRSLDDEPALLTAAGSATRLMLENARLQAEVRAQLLEVRESRSRIVTAANAARAQLERDLHDGAQQRLLAIGLALRLLREQPGETTVLDAADAELSSALAELRELAAGIHPAVLTDLGLVAALKGLASRLGTRVRLVVPAEVRRASPEAEAALYFSTSEAITNALKHAAPAVVQVNVTDAGDKIMVRVSDNGPGGADPTGSGLLGIRDRLASVDGTLLIRTRPGHGTELTLEVPCG